jgi:hypothetical protein
MTSHHILHIKIISEGISIIRDDHVYLQANKRDHLTNSPIPHWMNPAFHVVNVALRAVSSFYARAESLQSFLPVQMWGHNSDGPAEDRKLYQLL